MSDPIYLAIGDHYWAVGPTPTAARAARRKLGGKGRPEVWKAPEGSTFVYVDQLGTAYADGAVNNEWEKVS